MKKLKRVKSVKLEKRKDNSTPSYGFEESIKKRWNSARELQELYQASRLRASQSPILKRSHKPTRIAKQNSSETSCVAKTSTIIPHNGSSDSLKAEEKVPLLKKSPWRHSNIPSVVTGQEMFVEPTVNAKYLMYMCNLSLTEKESS